MKDKVGKLEAPFSELKIWSERMRGWRCLEFDSFQAVAIISVLSMRPLCKFLLLSLFTPMFQVLVNYVRTWLPFKNHHLLNLGRDNI